MKIKNTHFYGKNLFLGAFASALMATSALASGTITLSSDKNNPTLWSDASSWSNGVVVNGTTTSDMAYMTLAEGQTVGYLTIDGDFDASNLRPSVAGEYHITVADGVTMGTGNPSNRLFFNNEATQAHIYVDSGKWDVNAGTAIVFGKTSSQSVTFSKDTSIDAGGQEFKVRSSYYADANKVATFAGSIKTTNNFQVYGNSASGSSTTAIVSGTVNAKALQVTYYNENYEENVGSAMELSGTVNITAADGANYVTGYGIGENSKATLLIKDGGIVNVTNASTSGFVVSAASHEDSGVALEIQEGGAMNLANNIALYGNSLNTNRAVALINGTLNANQVIIGGAKNTRVDVGATAKITTKGNVNVGSESYTDNTKGAVLNINGGTHTFGANLNVGYRKDNNVYTGSIVNFNGGTTTIKGALKTVGSSKVNISGGEVFANGNIEVATHGKLIVSGTGRFEIDGNLSINHIGNNTANTQIVINTSGNKIGGYIYLPETGKIEVGASNDWSNVDFYARGGATKLTITGGTLELNTILWGNKSASGAVLAKEFTLDIADGAKLVLNSILGAATLSNESYAGLGEIEGNSTLKILNFDENKIFVYEVGSEEDQLAFLNRVSFTGLDRENLHFQYDSVAGGYWLSNIAVPEPAEWAMIFGGIALGFAIYRRRK